MALEVCSKWGTFIWGDGAKYCNNSEIPNKFYIIIGALTPARPFEPTAFLNIAFNTDTVVLPPDPRHRYSLVIKHSNGSRYSLYSILAHIGTRSYEPFPNTINVDQLTGDRISLIIKHSNGTKFQLFTVRPLIQPRRKRLVG